MLKPVITTFGWVPPFARGVTRDLRARWACEEEGIKYEIHEINWERAKSQDFRRLQPFGQIPTYNDGEVEIFETGAIALRIAEIGGSLLPEEPAARMRAIQWVIASLNSVEPWIMRAIAESSASDADAALLSTGEAVSELRSDGMSGTGSTQVLIDLNKRLVDLDAAIADKQWVDGDTFTVGDLMMVSVLGNLRNTQALYSMPRLADYVARAEARPAHVRAMAAQLMLYETADRTIQQMQQG